MWFRIGLLVSFCVFCTGKKDFSCNFNYDTCGWYVTWGIRCHWVLSYDTFDKKRGFLYVKGSPNCHTTLTWDFSYFDGFLPNYLTIDYYVIGKGPFTLSVSNDVENYKVDWSCEIQPGNMKRQARVLITGKASYIYINVHVTTGSKLIITQVRNDLQGHKRETKCPLLPTTPPPPTTTITTVPTTTTPTTMPLTTTTVPTTKNIIPAKTTNTAQDHKTITTNSHPKKPKNHTTSEIVTPLSTLQNTRPFSVSTHPTTLKTENLSTKARNIVNNTNPTEARSISTSSVIRTTNSATSLSRNTKEKSRTQTTIQTFSTISYQTKLSSSFLNSTKIPNSQSTSNLVTNMTTESTTMSAMFVAEQRKVKRTVIIVGSTGGLAVLIILISLVTFFIIRRRRRLEIYDVSLALSNEF